MPHPCQLCQTPTEARTCLTCVGVFETLLDQATTVLPELTDEAAGLAQKAPGGWSTSTEGTPLGIRLAPIQAKAELESAVKAIGRNIGSSARSPKRVKAEAYKLAWPAANSDDLKTLHMDLGLAVRKAERIINPPPELILFGWCPSCGDLVRAPSDRTYHTCYCGQGIDLIKLKESRNEIIHDRLDGTYLSSADTAYALATCGYQESHEQVSIWGIRGKVHREKAGGKWLYLFDDALHQAELKALRRKKSKKVLDRP